MHQFVVGAGSSDTTSFDEINPIGKSDGRQPVGDEDDGYLAADGLDIFPDNLLGDGVQR